jgi:hypothetical protein
VNPKKEPSTASLLPKRGLFGKKGEKGKLAASQELNLTPLNTGLVDILREVMTIPEARYPTPIRAPPDKRSTNKYCEYHRDHGHDMEDCISLKIEIERLIRNGKLARFVADQGWPIPVTGGQQGPGGRRPQPWPRGCDNRVRGPGCGQDRDHLGRGLDIARSPRRNVNRECELREGLLHEDNESEEEQPFPFAVRGNKGRQEVERRRHPDNRLVIHNRVIGDINTIVGGFTKGEESSSAQRNHARSLASGEVLSIARPPKSQRRETSPIMFTDEDLQGVAFPHDDALVVTLLISNYNVHKYS